MSANRFRFRAWDTILSRMLDISDFRISDLQGSEFFNEGDFIFMQSTGLTDKSGKEIFEGDICRFYGRYHKQRTDKDRIGFVRAGSFAFRGFDMCRLGEIFQGKQTYEAAQSITFGKKGNALEILGNVYENPELLPPC